MNPFANRRAVLGVAFAALLTGACQWSRPLEPKVINHYLAEPTDLANVRRIMVLPFRREADVEVDTAAVRDAFVAELQKLRRFEVVPLPAAAREDDEINLSMSLGRLSTAEDVAKAALWLASDEASFITGVALEVDGGRCI